MSDKDKLKEMIKERLKKFDRASLEDLAELLMKLKREKARPSSAKR